MGKPSAGRVKAWPRRDPLEAARSPLSARGSCAWVKSKCLNRAEVVIVGWSDPEGARPLLGALLLGYYEPDGRLIYAGRVGTGMPVKTLAMLHERLRPLAIKTMDDASRQSAAARTALWRPAGAFGSDRSLSRRSHT
jgi:ATP-dependent DNA ligase